MVTLPPTIQFSATSPVITLNWPGSYLGWLLQSNAAGLSTTNWSMVPNSGNVTNFLITIDPTMGNVFYRLVSP
ncbi:MAG TPA: hypothetical protein VK815_12195 [Candidatus Acidoferrales bacterium]|jgi:hypothetical protein|nr:hypothetical protein [Candidatus Acidoferrales bacterium]